MQGNLTGKTPSSGTVRWLARMRAMMPMIGSAQTKAEG